MSRLTNLFESSNSQTQTYAKQPLLTVRFETDPSLRRVLVQEEYFTALPQRVLGMANLLRSAAQKAYSSSDTSPRLWDHIIGTLSGINQALEQSLAIAGHVSDPSVTSKPSLVVQKSILVTFRMSLQSRKKNDELLEILTLWYKLVEELADDPASDAFAPSYTQYAEKLKHFVQSLATTFKNKTAVDLALPTYANTLGDEILSENDQRPRNFMKALNHEDSQQTVTNALSWLVENTSGAVWTGEVLNFVSSLEDVSEYLQNMDQDSMFSGELNSKTARKLATSFTFAGNAMQRVLMTGLTADMEKAGIWDNPPTDATDKDVPNELKRIFNDYDYLSLRDNILYALATKGGYAAVELYNKMVRSFVETAMLVKTGKILTSLDVSERMNCVKALDQTGTKLERVLSQLSSTFKQVGLLETPLPANRITH